MLADLLFHESMVSFDLETAEWFNDELASSLGKLYLSFWSYGRGGCADDLMDGVEESSSSSVTDLK
jgi:hypothetical protein